MLEQISDLIKTQNTYELESSLIWNTITEILPGNSIPNRPLSYDSSEFGIISQKGIIETLMQVFGAKPSQNRREKRKLIFYKNKLERLSKIYDLSINVKVGTSSTVTDVTDVGLDSHFEEQSEEEEIGKNQEQNCDNSKEKDKDNEEITSQKNEESHPQSPNASQASHPSPKPILLSNDDSVKPVKEGKKYRLNHLLLLLIENPNVFTVGILFKTT